MVVPMINEPGQPTGGRRSQRETTMLKTISAALLAVSVLAAPAMAAGVAKTTPVTKTETTKTAAAKTAADKTASVKIAKPAPAIKAVRAKPSVMNANARMGRHHVRHHRFHKHMGAYKAHQSSKLSLRHTRSAVKRG